MWSWTFEGTPAALLARTLADLEAAAGEDDWEWHRDRAFVSLVGRYLLEERTEPLAPDRLEAFRLESARLIQAIPKVRVQRFVNSAWQAALEAETAPELWETVCLYRSAVQLLLDDYADTPIPGWFLEDDLEELDEQVRESAASPDLEPVRPEQKPSRLLDRHWWWTAPEKTATEPR